MIYLLNMTIFHSYMSAYWREKNLWFFNIAPEAMADYILTYINMLFLTEVKHGFSVQWSFNRFITIADLPATVAGAAPWVTSLLLKVSSDPAEIVVSLETIWCTWSKDVNCGLVMNYITLWLWLT